MFWFALCALVAYGAAIPLLSLLDWQRAPNRARWGRGALWLGVTAHSVSLAVALAVYGLAWSLTPEHAIAVIAFTCAVVYTLSIRANPRWQSFAGIFVPLVFFLQLIAVTHDRLLASTAVSPFAPLREPTLWLPLHLLVAMVSFALLLMGAISGVVYLWSESRLKSRVVTVRWLSVPSLPVQEQLLARLVLIGFFGLSLTVATGLLLQILSHRASHLWLPVAGWGIYSVALHSSLLRHQPGRRLITLSLIGFAVILLSFVQAHSMAGQ